MDDQTHGSVGNRDNPSTFGSTGGSSPGSDRNPNLKVTEAAATHSEEIQFGQIALEWSLIERRQLEECLQEQDREREQGREVPLDQLLFQRGWLNTEDIVRVLKEQSRRSEGIPNIPRYELQQRLGEGATAVVYRAWDRQLKRLVALKILRNPTGLTVVARQRFQREAQAAGVISHPNVVTVYDAGESEGRAYLVMELIEGRPFSVILADRPRDLRARRTAGRWPGFSATTAP